MIPTRFIMAASSICLAVAGLALLFAPAESLGLAGFPDSNPLTGQLLSATYLGGAAANWMARGVKIGGIYARPLAIANYIHFLVGSIVLAVGAAKGGLSFGLMAVLFAYAVFGALFALLVFGVRQ